MTIIDAADERLRALLGARIEAALADTGAPAAEPIAVQTGEADAVPMSDGQRRVWLDSQLGAAVSYHVPLVLHLCGPLDADRLTVAIREVARRHRVLRSVVTATGRGDVLVAVDPAAIPVTVIDLARADLDEAVEGAIARPFDLRVDVPTRAALLRLDDDEHVLVLTFHHIAVDDVSLGIVQDDLARAYDGIADTAERRPQYADYTVWATAPSASRREDEQVDWWAQRLAGLAAELALPADRPRAEAADFAGDSVPVEFPSGLGERVRSVASEFGMTPYMVFLAAWQLLLARMSGESDIAVGVPYSGRTHPGTESMVGFFVNSLVLRTSVEPTMSGRELLMRVRESVLEALAHGEAPYQRVVERLNPDRTPGVNPFFQTVVNLLGDGARRAAVGGLTVTPWPVRSLTSRFDLGLDLIERGGEFTGEIAYRSARFARTEVERWAGWYARVIDDLLTHVDRTIADIDLTTDRVALLHAGTGANLTAAASVATEIDGWAARRPDAIASTGPDGSLTYSELIAWSQRLARRLRRLGVEPGSRIGVCVPRDRWLPATLLAVWRAGAAYVPLDPDLPVRRLDRLIAHAGVEIVVARGTAVDVATSTGAATVLDVDATPETLDPTPLPGAAGLAYILYTSGSTGEPKGVAVTHANLAALAAAMRTRPGIGPYDTMLAVAPLAFDASCLEIWVPLAAGAHCVIAERAVAIDGHALAAALSAADLTVAHIVPTALRSVMDVGWAGNAGLRLWTGSEALDPTLAQQVRGRVRELWNFYGPTEATVISTAHQVGADDDTIVPIGSPLAGERLYVVDAHGTLAPRGIPGELWLGGAGVAAGYWNDEATTAVAFIADSFHGDGRCYRTGDLVRWREDGTLQFLGRRDRQVKIRGYRIELGEVEAAILSHPEVAHAVVEMDASGTRLIAYVVPADGAQAAAEAIEAHVRQRVPAYMMPTLWAAVPAVPTLPSGKVDRAALPAPVAAVRARRAAQTEAELLVADVWTAVLDRSDICADDDFFRLGGHSFAATQVATVLRDALGVAVPVRTIFDHPRLSDFAHHVEQLLMSNGEPND